MTFYAACGLLGAMTSMLAYIAMVTKKIEPYSYTFLGAGVVASAGIGISLIGEFNTASLIMQIFYGGISIYGILQLRKKK